MKKICTLIFLFFCNINFLFSQNSLFDYSKTFDINYSYNCYKCTNNSLNGLNGCKISTIIYGFYFDGSFNTEENYCRNTGVNKFYGYKTSSFHIGYSFPVFPWLRIIPVLGQATFAEGYYNGLDHVTKLDTICNEFYITGNNYKKLDYGVNIIVTLFKFINFCVSFERYNYSYGLGISIPLYLY